MSIQERLMRPDRRAAVAALMGMLILAAGFRASIPVALIGGAVVYLVVALSPGMGTGKRADSPADVAERATLAYETAEARVAAIGALADRIPKEGTRDLVLRIRDQSASALALMQQKNRVSAAPLLLEQLLEPAESLLETYVRFTERGAPTSGESLARTEGQDLPMIERASRLFLQELERDGDETALTRALEFQPESATVVTPRRS